VQVSPPFRVTVPVVGGQFSVAHRASIARTDAFGRVSAEILLRLGLLGDAGSLNLMSDGPTLTITEAADELGLDGSEVYGLVFAGQLEFTQAENGRILVRRRALDDHRARVASHTSTTS